MLQENVVPPQHGSTSQHQKAKSTTGNLLGLNNPLGNTESYQHLSHWHCTGWLSLIWTNLLNKLNTASMQDTAHDHTNQMGDFFTPMRFGRVLPPDYSPHGMGVSGPPYDGLRGHVPLI